MTGSGTQADPYVIWDVNDLQDMEDDLSAYYELGCDIDASGVSFRGIGYWWSGPDWHTAPAGYHCLILGVPDYALYPFTGNFDGKGHTISNLTISESLIPYNYMQGLFAAIENATIHDVILTDISITVNQESHGLFAGDIYGGEVYNCNVDGQIIASGNITYLAGFTAYAYGSAYIHDCSAEVEVTGAAVDHIAGFVAMTFDKGGSSPTIEDCLSELTYSAPAGLGSYAGGFVALAIDDTEFSRCCSTANISSYDDYLGGFVASSQNNCSYEKCYSSGTVEELQPGQSNIGGFVGSAFNTTSFGNCYSRCNVTGTDGGNYGGFAGDTSADVAITNCYSTSLVTAEPAATDVGGFCGYNAGTITDCFWDTRTSGQSSSSGGTGKITAQMKRKNTFTNWSFGDTWGLWISCNNGYPCLLDVTPSCRYAPFLGNINVDQLIYQHAERMR